MLLPPMVNRLIGRWEPLVFRLARTLPWYTQTFVSDARPIIVGGCGRSGTTLMRVILDTHDQVCCGPETSLLCCWRPQPFFAQRLAQSFDLPPHDIRQWMSQSRGHAEFVDRFFHQVCQRNRAQRWAEKTPRNVHAIDYIFRHFPQARFVHIIRDGRDTVCSLRRHPRFRTIDGRTVPTNIDNPLSGCVHRWVTDVQAGLRFRQDPRYYEIRYEDLVDNPEYALRPLFQFLELPWQNQVLQFHQVQSDLRDVARFPQNPEATRPMYQSAVGRWQQDLDQRQRAYVKRHAGQLLIQLGYAADDRW